jgi:hypothetical protein
VRENGADHSATPASAAGRLVEALEQAWRPMRALAEELGHDGLERPTSAGWTAKEMLAHVAFWNEAAVPVITYLFRGVPMPPNWEFGSGVYESQDWPAADVHNAREAAWARNRRPAEVLERCEAAHAKLIAALETVTDAEAEAQAAYFADLPEHLVKHLPELEEIART